MERAMSNYLESRRSTTDARLERLRNDLAAAEALAGDRACVYLTGSFARGEAGSHSDLDLFIMGKGTKEKPALRRLDEICIKADLIESTRKHDIPDFSRDGEYLVHYTEDELIGTLGSQQDDACNTFTARLLLLLESRALIGESVYVDTIQAVVAAYWGEYEDHKSNFVPAFLVNDILRLWRTFCVNYEARTSKAPAEKKAKRKLTNYKLKHSRLLTCYSALSYLLAIYAENTTVSPADAIEMVRMSPTQRLEWLRTAPGVADAAKSKVDELLNSYEGFLRNTDTSEKSLLDQFMGAETSQRYLTEAREFGDKMHALLELLGRGTLLHRLLTV